jgi:hypothetical protein
MEILKLTGAEHITVDAETLSALIDGGASRSLQDGR